MSLQIRFSPEDEQIARRAKKMYDGNYADFAGGKIDMDEYQNRLAYIREWEDDCWEDYLARRADEQRQG